MAALIWFKKTKKKEKKRTEPNNVGYYRGSEISIVWLHDRRIGRFTQASRGTLAGRISAHTPRSVYWGSGHHPPGGEEDASRAR